MFTAEELENCDIFPKKITLGGLVKFVIYFAIMFTGFLFIMSLYTGRDIKHLISLDTIKYGPNSELLEQLYSLDSKFNYNLQDKYNFDFKSGEAENRFIQDYVSQSVPCIIKNLSLEFPAYRLWTNNNYDNSDNSNESGFEQQENKLNSNLKEQLNEKALLNSEFKFVDESRNNNDNNNNDNHNNNKGNSTEKASEALNPLRLAKLSEAFANFDFVVEVKSDPLANFISSSSDFTFERLNYLNFYEKATNPQRLKNYFINNHIMPETTHKFISDFSNDKKGENEKFNFLRFANKNLVFKNLKFSEGFGESVIPAHYDKEEQIICELIGSIDIVIIPQLYRNTVYAFKKGFGPTDYSPVNFFESEFGRFPNFAKSHRLMITLNQGDCLYLPAYWWFNIRTAKQSHFMFVSLNYSSHSQMLDYMIRTIEKEEI